MVHSQMQEVADQLPSSIDELRACGISENICDRYGDRILKFVNQYYHVRGLFAILADCASQISLPD